MKRNWTLVGCLAAALAVTGCGGDGGGGGGGGGTDGGGGVDARPDGGGGGSASDYLYVISELKVPDLNTECIGLNLDGDNGTVCGQLDCGDGVDNNFAALLNAAAGLGGGGTDIGASIQDNINKGKLVLLVRLRDVNSFVDDDDVRVEVMLGMLPEGTDMPMLDASGRLAPGQTFDIDERSLEMGEPMASVAARITGGKLDSDPVDLPLNFTVSGEELTLVLEDTRLVADSVSADGISMGVLGGAISIPAVIDLVCKFSPDNAGTAIPLLTSFADLESTPGSGTCDLISAGLGFTTVAANAGTTRTPPMSTTDGGMGDGGTGMLPPECMMDGGTGG